MKCKVSMRIILSALKHLASFTACMSTQKPQCFGPVLCWGLAAMCLSCGVLMMLHFSLTLAGAHSIGLTARSTSAVSMGIAALPLRIGFFPGAQLIFASSLLCHGPCPPHILGWMSKSQAVYGPCWIS